MNRILPLTLALVAVATAGAAIAQTSTPGAQHAPHRQMLDANHDGVIDRVEAAAQPRLAAMFDRLDRNHDGRLGADEQPHMRGRHGGHQGSGGGIARLDANGDGRIGRDEIAGKAKFATDFTAMDSNHDGYLVRSELQAYQQSMRPQRIAEQAKRFDERFAAADLNHDGKLSKVEVSEKMPRLAKGFAWTDDNRDGFLSREELRPTQR